MDVGSVNFQFKSDEPEKQSKAFRYPLSAELHVSSLDRINSSAVQPNQILAQLTADASATLSTSSATDCQIQTKKALLYGYFNRIAMTEFQLFFRVPTVIAGVNNTFFLQIWPGGYVPGGSSSYQISIPGGYYTPVLLAAAIQAAIRAATTNLTNAAIFTVTAPTSQSTINALTTGSIATGFTFATNNTDAITLVNPPISVVSESVQLAVGKFYRLIGANTLSFIGFPAGIPTASFVTPSPNFLPTDYIDIVSKSLTNYKDTKDTNSSEQAPQGVLGRIYLTDAGALPQMAVTNSFMDPNTLGCAPFTITKKWQAPNWSQWSPNQAINTVDIKLLDMYGNPLFWSNTVGCATTEWEMTILASE